LIFEVGAEDIEKATVLITKTMQPIVSLKVPLVVEADVDKIWAEI
jgi:DNA polymerase I-like protein with 3'-5' exonuclease and polymerase domains